MILRRILRVYPYLPPCPGGLEKHVYKLSEEQRALGLDVVIAFSKGNSTSGSDIRVLNRYGLIGVRPRFLRDALFYGALVLHLIRCKSYFDVVHIHGDWSAFFWGPIIKWLTGAEVLAGSVHGATRKSWGRVYCSSLKRFTVTFATGARDAKFLREKGVDPVFWQSSGVASIFFEQQPPSYYSRNIDVVVVGNLLPVKNIDFVLDVASRMPNYIFHIVGSGPEQDRLLRVCAAKSLSNVFFLGSLSADEVAHVLGKSKVLLSTSISEGTPTSLLEAMACGLPVVTSESNDYDLLIENGVNGYVISGFDSVEYQRHLEKIICSESIWCRMSQANFYLRERLSWPGVAKRITDLSISRHGSAKNR